MLNIQQQSAHHKEKLEQADKDMNKNDNENSEENKNSTSKSLKPPVDPLQNDWRLFECNTWHLEPTVIFKQNAHVTINIFVSKSGHVINRIIERFFFIFS